MDRVDAIAKYIINQTKKNREDLGFILIGEIYDDFESRTCENCNHFESRLKICWMRVEIDGYMNKDFGCNKFKRRTNG